MVRFRLLDIVTRILQEFYWIRLGVLYWVCMMTVCFLLLVLLTWLSYWSWYLLSFSTVKKTPIFLFIFNEYLVERYFETMQIFCFSSYFYPLILASNCRSSFYCVVCLSGDFQFLSLLLGRVVSPIYLFITLLILIWTYRCFILFYELQSRFSFYCSDCSSFGCWELLQVAWSILWLYPHQFLSNALLSGTSPGLSCIFPAWLPLTRKIQVFFWGFRCLCLTGNFGTEK